MPAPTRRLRTRWWIAGGAVVILAASAGTIAAISSGGDTWNPKLPSCAQLAAALPGKPPLSETLRIAGDESAGGLRPAHMASVACASDQARAGVDILDSGEYDPVTMEQYANGKTLDGPARAKALFATLTRGLTAASPTEAYGSIDYSDDECTTIAVRKNVLVTVTVYPSAPGTTADARNATCKTVGAKDMAAVMSALG